MDKKPTFTVPIAIVVAGVLVAGAIFFSGRTGSSDNSGPRNNPGSSTVQTKDISIRQVNDSDYIRGNPDAKVVIVEFSDTECPYCKRFHVTMKSLVDKLGKDGTIAWVYRNFPIRELHPDAPKQSEALLCAGKVGGSLGFWNYTDRIYEITPANNGLALDQLPVIAEYVGIDKAAFVNCLESGEMAQKVTADYEDGIKGGASGTPHSVLIAKDAFDKDKVEQYLIDSMIRLGFPPDLVAMSNDNKKVAVSGAMPQDFLEGLISLMSE